MTDSWLQIKVSISLKAYWLLTNSRLSSPSWRIKAALFDFAMKGEVQEVGLLPSKFCDCPPILFRGQSLTTVDPSWWWWFLKFHICLSGSYWWTTSSEASCEDSRLCSSTEAELESERDKKWTYGRAKCDSKGTFAAAKYRYWTCDWLVGGLLAVVCLQTCVNVCGVLRGLECLSLDKYGLLSGAYH